MSDITKTFLRGIKASIFIFSILVFWDVVFTGSFLMSLYLCPVWILFSILKNVIRRPGWKLAGIRIAIPVVTFVLVLSNSNLQLNIASANARQIIAACEEFHTANGRYPNSLLELVPKYLASVPRAKYCLIFGEFKYSPLDDANALLFYCIIPPHGQTVYNFRIQEWKDLY
jgi:hypothetical protein